MLVTVAGEKKEIEQGTTIAKLIEIEKVENPEYVTVTVNDEFLNRVDFETYIIKGERGSGKICLNGAAARKVQPDDIVIIMSYALMDFEEAKTFKPTVIFPDPATNKVVK